MISLFFLCPQQKTYTLHYTTVHYMSACTHDSVPHSPPTPTAYSSVQSTPPPPSKTRGTAKQPGSSQKVWGAQKIHHAQKLRRQGGKGLFPHVSSVSSPSGDSLPFPFSWPTPHHTTSRPLSSSHFCMLESEVNRPQVVSVGWCCRL